MNTTYSICIITLLNNQNQEFRMKIKKPNIAFYFWTQEIFRQYRHRARYRMTK